MRVETNFSNFGYTARCVFVVQTMRLYYKKPCRGTRVTRDNCSKVAIETTPKKEHLTMGTQNPNGSDRWRHTNFRVTDGKERAKIEQLFQKSGMRTKTAYIRLRLLDKNFRTTKVDTSLLRFCDQLADLIYQVNKIGVNYNQTVHAINVHHGVKVSVLLLKDLCKKTDMLNERLEKIVALEEELRKKIETKENAE